MSLYQAIRTTVKKRLNHLVEFVDMEFAIRAATPLSVPEAEAALREHLAEHGFHVVHETDVKAIHEHYNLAYPEFKILKVASADRLGACEMATGAIEANPGMGVFLPPSIALYEAEGETRVSAVRPTTLLALFTESELHETIRELEGVLWDALENGIPESRMLSESPPLPLGAGDRRATLKKRLNLLLNLVDAEYTIHVSSDAPREEIVGSLRDALTLRGQHVLGEVGDILLVVNPGQAHKALAIEPDVAVFAPLSVSVTEEDGRTHVRAVRPSTLLIFFTDPDLQDILREMEMLLWNALVEGVPDATVHSRQPPLPPTTGQRTTGAGLPGGLDSKRKFRPG